MSAYLAIRVLLLLALAVSAWWLMRPVTSASSLALRRLGIGLLVTAAIVAILVPSLANTVARAIGVERGVNLIVYGLVLASIAQMITAYRREARAEARMARLARALALAHVLPPRDHGAREAPAPPSNDGTQEVGRAASGPASPTNKPDNDMVTTNE